MVPPATGSVASIKWFRGSSSRPEEAGASDSMGKPALHRAMVSPGCSSPHRTDLPPVSLRSKNEPVSFTGHRRYLHCRFRAHVSTESAFGFESRTARSPGIHHRSGSVRAAHGYASCRTFDLQPVEESAAPRTRHRCSSSRSSPRHLTSTHCCRFFSAEPLSTAHRRGMHAQRRQYRIRSSLTFVGNCSVCQGFHRPFRQSQDLLVIRYHECDSRYPSRPSESRGRSCTRTDRRVEGKVNSAYDIRDSRDITICDSGDRLENIASEAAISPSFPSQVDDYAESAASGMPERRLHAPRSSDPVCQGTRRKRS